MKIILVGGTMESNFALSYVADVISKIEPEADVSVYTYGFAMQHKHEINQIIKDNVLITHSTGAMVIERGAHPSKVVFIAPSQPVARWRIVYRATIKTLFHSWKILTFKDRSKVVRIIFSNITELFVHPLRNIGPFVRGDVSKFDLRKVLPRHPAGGSARIVISKRDEMFRSDENRMEDLAEHGVEVVHVDAMHDEIFIDTDTIIRTALKK